MESAIEQARISEQRWKMNHDGDSEYVGERMFPKYAVCSSGRLGEIQKLGSHPFYADREPNWAYKGRKVFPQENEDPRWMSHATSARFLSSAECDALDALLEKAWMYDDLCK